MTTTTMNGFNEQSAKVLNYMQGWRSAEQMVWEFFGLRKEAVYNDQWDTVTDFINDFNNDAVLKTKGVYLHPKLIEKGITEAIFNGLFNNVPNYGPKWTIGANTERKWEENNDWGNGIVEDKSELPSPKKWATKSSK